MPVQFISPSKGERHITQVRTELLNYLKSEPTAEYKIVIGSDSQTFQHETVFITALIIHREGKGAIFYYRKWNESPYVDLRHRIYKETEFSLETITALRENGFSELLEEYPLEVHIDVGMKGETRKLIQEIVGWVTAVGYEAKIKPDSFGASSVADKFT